VEEANIGDLVEVVVRVDNLGGKNIWDLFSIYLEKEGNIVGTKTDSGLLVGENKTYRIKWDTTGLLPGLRASTVRPDFPCRRPGPKGAAGSASGHPVQPSRSQMR